MQRKLVLCVVVAAMATLSTAALAGGEVNLFYGRKDMDFGLDLSGAPSGAAQTISNLEDQDEWGLLTTWGHQWPVALAIDFLSSSQDDTLRYTYAPGTYGGGSYALKIDFETKELDVGIRKYWLE
ncbi:MAG: hypothetical protein R3344_07620, partial [Acidobacteriota bacterium]|nr:hypothetical protein [Acidobacteriota bacterium]